MNVSRLAAPLAGFVLFATPAFALEVSTETEVAAAPQKVWSTIGGFCAIAEWHPAVASCEEREVDGAPHRILSLEGGGTIEEALVSRDDTGMTYTYRIVESPLPVANYESTIAVSGEGDTSMLSWEGTFDAAEGASDEDAIGAITGIYESGLAAISERATGM
ncbi:SRPBCC family protein [Fulvimarina sp. MAC3]|uniref:SRPBCC family protein n=1 Tax=Fulvimarina sp. MAC3 TaxID=3148887 RepID=UPI0031FBD685